MLSRIFQILTDSFKFLYREKVSFYISSITISICIIILILISSLSFKLIKKIDTIQRPPLVVTYEEMYGKCKDCPSHEGYEDLNANGKWDDSENFIDSNGNGIYDAYAPCPECDIYDSKFLNPLETDSKLDKDNKKECKYCIENILGMADGDCFSDYELILVCESECTPNLESLYALNEYNQGEYFKDINNNDKWDKDLEPFIDNDYYGSRKKSKCGGCLHFMYLEARNSVRSMDNINTELNFIDKVGALVDYEIFVENKYFENRPDRSIIDLPVYSEFEIDQAIDKESSLDSIIYEVIDLEYIQDIDPDSMLDYTTFISYQQLSRIITSSVPVLIFFILLIPFFIVSNTIHLVIYSKRDVLSTLRILGEKDFYIKLPFVFQGIWQGVIGSSIAIFLTFTLEIIGLGNIMDNIVNTVITQSSVNIEDNNLIYSFKHSMVILFLGITLGIFGALRAISKYLK